MNGLKFPDKLEVLTESKFADTIFLEQERGNYWKNNVAADSDELKTSKTESYFTRSIRVVSLYLQQVFTTIPFMFM
jgi:hypothetical protein